MPFPRTHGLISASDFLRLFYAIAVFGLVWGSMPKHLGSRDVLYWMHAKFRSQARPITAAWFPMHDNMRRQRASAARQAPTD